MVAADADIDRRRTEIARPIRDRPRERFADQVIGRLRQVRPVLFRRSQRDQCERF